LIRTIAELFYEALGHNLPDAMAFRSGGAYVPLSHGEIQARVERLVLALKAEGLQAGDRVAILSENRPEWAMTDYACAILGIVSAPVYPTLNPNQTEYIIRHSGARVIFCSSRGQLEKVLQALRPYTRGRLIVVFGCGGDRDPGKRPIMGRIGVDFADVAIVTDDNPRSEDPAEIRRQVLGGAPGAIEIGDRGRAIREAVGMLKVGDVLVVAGKGHETGQIVGKTVLPFSDHDSVAAALQELAP